MPIYSTKFRALWVDTDSAGIVHFSNYFRYCERTEEEFLNKLGLDYISIAKKYQVTFPRVFASCKYKFPIRYNQIVRVDLEDLEFSDKQIKFKYKIYNETEGREAAICEIIIASTDLEINKSVPIPDEIVEKFRSVMSNQ